MLCVKIYKYVLSNLHTLLCAKSCKVYSAPYEVVPYTEDPFSHYWWTHPMKMKMQHSLLGVLGMILLLGSSEKYKLCCQGWIYIWAGTSLDKSTSGFLESHHCQKLVEKSDWIYFC